MTARAPRSTDRRPETPTRSRAVRLAFWLVLIVAAAGLVLGALATPVDAHAYLSDSDPSNAEQLEDRPEQVTLSFSGDGVQVADVTVTNPDGEVVSGESEIDPDDTRTVRIPLEETADGSDGMYSVDWEVLADDGHTTSGSFFFSVGDEPLDRDAVLEAYEDGTDEPDEEIPPIETIAKGLVLVALVALVGAPVTAAVAVYPPVGRTGPDTRSVDRCLSRLLVGATLLLVGAVIALGLARAASLGRLSAETLAQYAETPLGRAWLVQIVLVSLLGGVLAVRRLGILSRRLWLAGVVLGSIAVAGSVSWTSHSATAIDRLRGVIVDFGHIAGAGLWIGGLLVLAVVVPAALRRTDPAARSAVAAGVVRRYSFLALAGATLAGATGLLLAAWHVPTLSALSETLYGVSLSAKTLLVLLALGLGGLTRFALLRRLESEPGDRNERSNGSDRDEPSDDSVSTFVRAVRLEVALLVVVVLLSGLLTSVPTAAVVGGGGDDGPGVASIEREGDPTVELFAIPAETAETADDDRLLVSEGDPIVFEVGFSSESTAGEDTGDRIASERTVRILATAVDGDTTIEFELEETADGTYATVQTLPEDGPWELRVTGSPDGSFLSEWFDATVVPAESADHDHDDHDHGDGHGHDDHETDPDSPFAVFLQFGAVAVAVVGSVAVAVEATRFGRSD
ncbi:copper resistance protein CopC [Natrarchaeobius halalkaliphilus]|uniref:Copper resistance protein CopC n=1 Tax=Natrarchaeobius halalkaliphilus TaxID=1679091 RepID=A0A3N6NX34_9EURY|nr:copper resistance protein CopC [Natrarchaeobius halalkaliphilus]RQG89199.1 copper resistance protein CopC [Natrarchaeobius halalkaliphilus]